MSKPYVVCYMMMSVDGRIDCPMVDKLPGVEEYYPLLDELGFQGIVCGKRTAELELARPGKFVPQDAASIGCSTFSRKTEGGKGYEIVADTKGTLLWKNDAEYEKPHIILTSESVSREYLAYLDERNISYIVAGKDAIDLKEAVRVLGKEFGVKRLGVTGGPAINTAFLDAGLLDEVVLLIGAGIDGRAAFPPVFNRTGESGAVPTRLKLLDVKSYDSGAVLTRYKTLGPN